MALINIIAPDSQFGYNADIKIVMSALVAAGHRVRLIRIQLFTSKVKRMLGVVRHPQAAVIRADLNVFLGPVFKEWVHLARRNVIIPNAEWFLPSWTSYIREFDAVWCKNRHAETVFANLGCRTQFIGFATPDARRAGTDKDFNKYFHVSSNGGKGTSRLLETWAKHPNWPTITVVSNRAEISGTGQLSEATNILLIRRYLDETELRKLQNESGIHLCPSEAEGYGHYITEAMSTGAVVVTTDGPPMNELIQPDRGMLVGVVKSEPMNMSAKHFFDPASLEVIMTRLQDMGADEKATLGRSARQWFEDNERAFEPRFHNALEAVLGRSS